MKVSISGVRMYPHFLLRLSRFVNRPCSRRGGVFSNPLSARLSADGCCGFWHRSGIQQRRGCHSKGFSHRIVRLPSEKIHPSFRSHGELCDMHVLLVQQPLPDGQSRLAAEEIEHNCQTKMAELSLGVHRPHPSSRGWHS